MKRTPGAALAALGLALSALLVPIQAHADPLPGQPCGQPGQYLPGPGLLCSPYNHQWKPEPHDVSRPVPIGAPCNVPQGPPVVIGSTGGAFYLAWCSQGRWAPYRP